MLCKIILQVLFVALLLFDVRYNLSGNRWISLLDTLTLWLLIPVLSNIYHYSLIRRRRLVTHHGLFYRIRHPMYLGDMIIILLLATHWLTWLVMPLALIVLSMIVVLAWREDLELRCRFPRIHDRWCYRSGLLWPRAKTTKR